MTEPRPGYELAKRCFDVTVSAVALTVLSPVLAGVAAAVKLDSRGPVFFRQERVGRNGERFRIHKFRTMEASHHGSLVSATGDSRVTRVGRTLRRSKLDELPQLLDVIRGSMSLVGPRPEVPYYVDRWPDAHRETILSVRPGVTDPVSVSLRNEADELAAAADPAAYYEEVLLPRKAAGYVSYVRGRTFAGDLGVIAQTMLSVVSP